MYHSWLDDLVKRALEEDTGPGDLTSENIVEPALHGEGVILARESGVIAGIDVVRRVYHAVDPGVTIESRIKDGNEVNKGDAIIKAAGAITSLLHAERTALNFLQHLSGIATKTREFCRVLQNHPAQLLDTRKTTPGLRYLEKYAVRLGGGRNHRRGLFDGVLIKENHITAAGGIKPALERVKRNIPLTVKTEIEVTSLPQLEEALEAGADIIMLDNWNLEDLPRAVHMVRGKAELEVSGEVTMDNLSEIAASGVDYVSSGAITHSAGILNFSFLLSQ